MQLLAMTIQISIGEIIEAMYEELIETYGDKELALVAAQALGDDLLERVAMKSRAAKLEQLGTVDLVA